MTDWMFSERIDTPDILGAVSSPIAKAADGGLKFLIGLMVKCTCLYVCPWHLLYLLENLGLFELLKHMCAWNIEYVLPGSPS